jgi:hypothetical protein
MAKVILEFDSVEEHEEIRTALDGYRWKLAMWDLDQGLRSTTKYGTSIINHGQEAATEELEVAEKMRELIRRVLEEYNLNLND